VLPPKKKRNVSHDFFTSRRAKRDIDVYDDAGKESDAKREIDVDDDSGKESDVDGGDELAGEKPCLDSKRARVVITFDVYAEHILRLGGATFSFSTWRCFVFALSSIRGLR
jgi:hypothetical protein